MALLLHRRGITRVRPLLGGLRAWRELQYPLQEHRPPQDVNPVPQTG